MPTDGGKEWNLAVAAREDLKQLQSFTDEVTSGFFDRNPELVGRALASPRFRVLGCLTSPNIHASNPKFQAITLEISPVVRRSALPALGLPTYCTGWVKANAKLTAQEWALQVTPEIEKALLDAQ